MVLLVVLLMVLVEEVSMKFSMILLSHGSNSGGVTGSATVDDG